MNNKDHLIKPKIPPKTLLNNPRLTTLINFVTDFVWIIHSIEFSNINVISNSFMYGFLLDLSEIIFNVIENEDEVFLQKFT